VIGEPACVSAGVQLENVHYFSIREWSPVEEEVEHLQSYRRRNRFEHAGSEASLTIRQDACPPCCTSNNSIGRFLS